MYVFVTATGKNFQEMFSFQGTYHKWLKWVAFLSQTDDNGDCIANFIVSLKRYPADSTKTAHLTPIVLT